MKIQKILSALMVILFVCTLFVSFKTNSATTLVQDDNFFQQIDTEQQMVIRKDEVTLSKSGKA